MLLNEVGNSSSHLKIIKFYHICMKHIFKNCKLYYLFQTLSKINTLKVQKYVKMLRKDT